MDRRTMLEKLTADDFAPLVDTEFAVALDTGIKAPLRLIEIGRYPPSGIGSRPAPFSLIFEGAAESAMGQRIYRLEHPDLTDLDIFLVPVGRHGGSIRYEAVFN
jgi:hypothetical protein